MDSIAQTSKENVEIKDGGKEKNSREDNDSLRYNLTENDRRLLLFFLGYLAQKNGRKAEKNREQSCLFVRKSLFTDMDTDEWQKPFDLENEIDWHTFVSTAGPWNKSREEAEKFLTYQGLHSSDLSECYFVRAFQTFDRIYPEEIHVRQSGYLICLLLGKVRLTCDRGESPLLLALVLVRCAPAR